MIRSFCCMGLFMINTEQILSIFSIKWANFNHKVSKVLGIGMIFAYMLSGTASAQNPNLRMPEKIPASKTNHYMLALVQNLSEICPPMLNAKQKQQFNEAYQNQLKIFMPDVSDPKETLRYLNTQNDYKEVLQGVRAWTASFPPSENKELCQEFAQASITF